MTSAIEYTSELAQVEQGRGGGGVYVGTAPQNTSVILGRPSVYSGAFSEDGTDRVRCLLPRILDLDRLCDEQPEGSKWPPKHRYKLAYVVHVIVRGYYQCHAEDAQDDARGVPLDAVVLRSLLVKNRQRDFAKEAVKALCTWGVIERTRNYWKGMARRYRVTLAYRDVGVEWRTFHAPRFVQKLCRRLERASAKAASSSPPFAFVRQNLSAVSLSNAGVIEAAAVLPAIADPRKKAAWLLSLHDLQQPAAHFSHSEKTGRIYHTVANCPKELRRHLLIDGEATAEVDISASQFFLLLGLYPKDCPERRRFAAMVTGGQFYEQLFGLMPEAQRKPWDDGSTSAGALWRHSDSKRGEFKRYAIRKLLYERLYPAQVPEGVWPAFAAEFPTLAEQIAARRRSRNDARSFCCEMQQREAALILGRVVPRIRDELPGCRPVTIHDGILCQRRFADDVKRIVEDQAAAMLGTPPAVRVKSSADKIPSQDVTAQAA